MPTSTEITALPEGVVENLEYLQYLEMLPVIVYMGIFAVSLWSIKIALRWK